EQLEPAFAAHFVERVRGGSLRFEHVLVREAFHDSLALAERRSLHERRARRLLSAPEGELPWAQLAQHLEESGPVSGMRPVDAWRHAAAQADARHAFDDAALCYARALKLLDNDPRTRPQTRAPLLLELAAAQIRAGDLEAGRRNSSEAFAIGETLGDANLMAEAA